MALNRQFPTSTTDPGGLDGNAYADGVAEEGDALWSYATVPCGTLTGTNTLVGACDVTIGLLTAGLSVSFVAPATNTGAMTLDVDSTGVKVLSDAAGAALTAGLVVVGTSYSVRYDGVQWRLDPHAFNMGSLITGYTEKTSPVVADTMAISDSEDGGSPKKIPLSALSGVLGGGWEVISVINPPLDVATLEVTGITGFSKIRGWALLQASAGGSALITVQARVAGGVWRSLASTATATTPRAQRLNFQITDFDGAEGSHVRMFRQDISSSTASIDRSGHLDIAGSTRSERTNYSTFSEVWTELRLNAGTGLFQGTIADQRCYFMLEGHR